METALASIKRRPADIERDIESKRYHYDQLRKLAAEFAAIDSRPFFFDPERQTITYTRDFNIPENLLAMLRDEAHAIAELERELYT